MAKFKLRNYKRQDNKKAIYLHFYYQGKKAPFKYPTNILIEEKHWSKKKERVKDSIGFKKAQSINDELNKLEKALNEVYDKRTLYTNKSLKERLEQHLNYNVSNVDFFEFAYKSNERLSYNTKRTWDSTVSVIKQFEESFGAITFNSFDMVFYNQFKSYCFEELNYANSTFSSRITHLKRILTNAESEGIYVNQGYKNKDFKKINYESDSVYLTKDELEKLKSVDLRGNKGLEYIRDVFLIRCYIGTRFGDSEITKNNLINIKGINFLKVFSNKSKKYIHIPNHIKAKEILDKLDWIIRPISNEQVNRDIKYICREAGITQKTTYAETRGGIVKELTKEKWERVGTHTARRTAATNMFLDGERIDLISELLGHSTIKQTQIYIKSDNLEKMLMLSNSKNYVE